MTKRQKVTGSATIVPSMVPDAVQLLYTEYRAQVVGDLLQALLVLLMNHKESDSLQQHTLLLHQACFLAKAETPTIIGIARRCTLWVQLMHTDLIVLSNIKIPICTLEWPQASSACGTTVNFMLRPCAHLR